MDYDKFFTDEECDMIQSIANNNRNCRGSIGNNETDRYFDE